LACGALAWPLAARAQSSKKVPRVGVLWIAPRAVVAPLHDALREGLRELGYVEGETIAIEMRDADGKIELLPERAAELVRLGADILVAPATPIAMALKKATATIPIVMSNAYDPVGFGLVESLSRPGGNMTGLANLTVEQVAKNVELCKEAIPSLSRLAVLVNPAVPDAVAVVREAGAAAKSFGLESEIVEARRPDEIESAIVSAKERGCEAALVSTIEGFFFANRVRMIEAAIARRLPAVFAAAPFGLARSGALIAYGASILDMHRRAALYIDKILKGASPAELPIQQPTKFELGVNLATAKALGLTIPQTILVRADEIVE
jgi:putative ABC transport system substrate-binding protein